MMVCLSIERLFVLRRVGELMFNNQLGINEQNNGVVESSSAHSEPLVVIHLGIEHIYIEVTIYRVNGIKYCKTFGGFTMSVRFQIFGKYLLYCIFYICGYHNRANKVNPFFEENEIIEKAFLQIVHLLLYKVVQRLLFFVFRVDKTLY